MLRFLSFILVVLLPLTAAAQDGQPEPELVLDVRPAMDVTLDEFMWLNRLIVVFADTELDPKFREQMELLAEEPAELAERDVVIITDTDPRGLSDIRKTLRPRGFGFVFIDKDGVIKLRKPAPWHVREIIRSIDKTELRRQEIRQQR